MTTYIICNPFTGERLYQYPATSYYQEAMNLLQRARANGYRAQVVLVNE